MKGVPMRRLTLTCAILSGLALVGMAQQSAPNEQVAPAVPRTLTTCEADVLDLKEALVKMQDAAATWQARATRAEAQLSLQAIAAERVKLKAPTAAAASQK
jgi:hypothetical protein